MKCLVPPAHCNISISLSQILELCLLQGRGVPGDLLRQHGQLAKKWQIVSSKRKKWISFPRTDREIKGGVADKGHSVFCSSNKKRNLTPLAYINTHIFQDLFKMSEEECGLSSGRPITMPCDSIFTEYQLSLIRKGVSESLGKALLNSIATDWCSVSATTCQEHI